jgi:hypothetical protein
LTAFAGARDVEGVTGWERWLHCARGGAGKRTVDKPLVLALAVVAARYVMVSFVLAAHCAPQKLGHRCQLLVAEAYPGVGVVLVFALYSHAQTDTHSSTQCAMHLNGCEATQTPSHSGAWHTTATAGHSACLVERQSPHKHPGSKNKLSLPAQGVKLMNGHCLCGAVHFEAAVAKEISACHCGFCRRWGGGPLLAVHCGPDVQFHGADHMSVYASSEWAERAFCKQCGTHLYYKLLATGDYFVPAGAFDTTALELTSQIYIDKKPPYYAFANQTPMLTEQQVIAQFAPPGSGTGD